MTADHCCKFGTVAAKYDREDCLDQLCAEWEQRDGRALRPLTTAFHERILHRKLTRAGVVPLDGELTSLAKGLDPNITATTTRAHAADHCRQYGLDPVEISKELPSYKTFQRHARNCEGCEPPKASIYTDSGPEQVRETVRGYRGRLSQIFEERIAALDRAGHIECGEVDIDMRITVNCQTCGDRTPIQQVIRSGCPGCVETHRGSHDRSQ